MAEPETRKPIDESADPGSPGNGAAPGAATPLGVGEKVGARFVVQEVGRVDDLGVVYTATDEKTGRTVALRVLAADRLPGEEALQALRSAVKGISRVQHKNVAATYGMGRAGANIFIAAEHVDGSSLRDLVQRKRQSGQPFSIRGAFNIVAHVGNALQALPTPHGRLSPDTIAVQRNGRVKVCDSGLQAATANVPRDEASTSAMRAYWAPEARSGSGAPTFEGDVYSMAVLLFEVLTSKPPRAGEPLSHLREDVPTAVDEVLATALADDPGLRPASPVALKEALRAAFGDALAKKGEGKAQAPVQADPSAAAPVAETATAPGVAAAGPEGEAAPSGEAPVPGTRVAADQHVRPGLPLGGGVQATFSVGDFALDEDIEKQERWLVSKGNEDWGPFTAEELRNQVRQVRVTEYDMVEDRETAERHVLNEIPYFQDFLVKWRPERQKQIELEKIAAARRRARNIRLAILAAIVAGLLSVAGGIVYILYGPKPVIDTGQAYPLDGEARIALLIASAEDDPQWVMKAYADSLPKGLGKKKLVKARKKGSGRAKWASGYDDSETVTLELSDEDDDGGIGNPLEPAALMPTWNANFGGVRKCLAGLGKGKYVVRFTIQPSGHTKAIRVVGKSKTPGENCVKGVLSKAKFPSNSVATPVDWPVNI